MCECCVNIKDLGCAKNCALIITGLIALVGGEYTVWFDFLGTQKQYIIKDDTGTPIVFGIGDPIDFEGSFLPESYINIFYLTDPNGVKMILDDGGNFYDCFKLKTILTQVI